MSKADSQKLYDTAMAIKPIITNYKSDMVLAQVINGNPKYNSFFDDIVSVSDEDKYRLHSIKDIVTKKDKQQAKEETFVKNYPVAELLTWYKDNIPGKKAIAVRQLKHRFLYLDYEDQVKVIDLFLDGSRGYRLWCYNRLKEWKDYRFRDKIISLWKEYHESECVDLMIKYLSQEDMYSIIHSILESKEMHRNDGLYYKLCNRFGKCGWLEVDIDRLRSYYNPSYYMWTVANCGLSLTKEECEQLLYDSIADEMESKPLYQYAEEHIKDDWNFFFPENSLSCPKVLGDKQFIYVVSILKMGHTDILEELSEYSNELNNRINEELGLYSHPIDIKKQEQQLLLPKMAKFEELFIKENKDKMSVKIESQTEDRTSDSLEGPFNEPDDYTMWIDENELPY